VREAIHDLGGVMLAITSALVPSQIGADGLQLIEAMQAGQVAMGWIALDGAQPKHPPAASPVPDSLRTFILHWGSQHATVGELLAIADRDLPATDAQTWATTHINQPGGTLPWQPIPGDPAAWFCLDLNAAMYILRRHIDAWKLLKSLSRIDGDPGTEDQIEQWATRAVRIRGDSRIIAWVPGPGTSPEFTTLHGSATPR
jgi:hypothetical protein